jgi:hypothetical protein
MPVLDQTPGLLNALRGEMTPKFLATRSPDGVPNVVPCVTMLPAKDQPDTLFFGNFLLRKSIKNLKQDTRIGVLVITPELRGWILKCDFVEFQRTGPYVERQMSGSLLRYNAYTGVRDAGIIRVKSVEQAFSISKLQVARDYMLARLAALRQGRRADGGVMMPLAVRREFSKMVAVKVLAWVGEDGYPTVIPALSLQPAGEKVLVGWKGQSRLPSPPPSALVATNILTFEAISYQAKGQWFGSGRQAAIQVQEVYAGGPPLPGGRVA